VPGLNCDTSFKYPFLDKESPKTVEIGLKSFKKTIPFVLAFNQKIAQVTLDDRVENKKTLFKIISREKVHDSKLEILNIQNGESNKTLMVGAKNQNLHICVEINKALGGYEIVKKPDDCPTLYADFPLIGSHSFIYPCIVNSHLFWPNEERSSILLERSSH